MQVVVSEHIPLLALLPMVHIKIKPTFIPSKQAVPLSSLELTCGAKKS
jgi:hypothetical protein